MTSQSTEAHRQPKILYVNQNFDHKNMQNQTKYKVF